MPGRGSGTFEGASGGFATPFGAAAGATSVVFSFWTVTAFSMCSAGWPSFAALPGASGAFAEESRTAGAAVAIESATIFGAGAEAPPVSGASAFALSSIFAAAFEGGGVASAGGGGLVSSAQARRGFQCNWKKSQRRHSSHKGANSVMGRAPMRAVDILRRLTGVTGTWRGATAREVPQLLCHI